MDELETHINSANSFLVAQEMLIFEIKSSTDSTNVHEGLAQLVSFGLSMQQQNKQTVYLHLVLITPKLWGFLVLPPCGMELEEPLEFRVILFYEDKKKRLVLDKTNYIWFLKYLKLALDFEGKAIPVSKKNLSLIHI